VLAQPGHLRGASRAPAALSGLAFAPITGIALSLAALLVAVSARYGITAMSCTSSRLAAIWPGVTRTSRRWFH
jgi:hypothetical protein